MRERERERDDDVDAALDPGRFPWPGCRGREGTGGMGARMSLLPWVPRCALLVDCLSPGILGDPELDPEPD